MEALYAVRLGYAAGKVAVQSTGTSGACNTTPPPSSLLLNFSYGCPEPVLVMDLNQNGSKRRF